MTVPAIQAIWAEHLAREHAFGCGTEAGARRHERAGQALCLDCRDARNRGNRDRAAVKREVAA